MKKRRWTSWRHESMNLLCHAGKFELAFLISCIRYFLTDTQDMLVLRIFPVLEVSDFIL